MHQNVTRAGEWFLNSGIQERNGGVARYYRVDGERNLPVSTEITGYALSALVYLHTLSGPAGDVYLEHAAAAADYLTGAAWDASTATMPFEIDPARYTYFFDCGIVARGLLAVWRATGEDRYLAVAARLGKSMAADFRADGDYHPILSLPGKQPVERDPLRWSRAPGCYQLKAGMAWWDLAEATGDEELRRRYDDLLEWSLRTCATFLPGHPQRAGVMDRLHAALYFLEGLLPRAAEACCAGALRKGIAEVAGYVREIAPEFLRSDVVAQLLRIRLYADAAGVEPLDRRAAEREAELLESFQSLDSDRRVYGGYCFGRRGGECIPHVSPVPTAFALQAMAIWEGSRTGDARPHRHLLI